MLQTDFEAQTHATFDALMWAFSHPGRMQTLPEKMGLDSATQIAEALLDMETSAWTDDPRLEKNIRATGAKIKSLEQADYLFCKQIPVPDLLRVIKRGSPLSPETAATLVLHTKLGIGATVRLTGAGIQDALEVQIDLPLEFWAVRDEVLAYPIGWDVLIVDGAKLLGLPRSTRIEVK